MNPQLTTGFQVATARVAESDRRAAQGWRAAEAAHLNPPRSARAWGDRGIVGALVAALVWVAGFAR